MRLVGLEGVIRAMLNRGSLVTRESRPRAHAPREQRGDDERQEDLPCELPDSAHIQR
jgi:hypothetical protein